MRYLTTALLLLLAACSSPPPVSYYQLPFAEVAKPDTPEPLKPLFIDPVQVAPYLNGRGLVLQVSDVELVMARQHLWAEALDQQLQRQLRHSVPLQAPAYVAQLQATADSVRLAVQIDRFHGTSAGYALISGRFTLSHQPTAHNFSLRLPLTNDGYPALVTALGAGVTQLATQIAQQLNVTP